MHAEVDHVWQLAAAQGLVVDHWQALNNMTCSCHAAWCIRMSLPQEAHSFVTCFGLLCKTS